MRRIYISFVALLAIGATALTGLMSSAIQMRGGETGYWTIVVGAASFVGAGVATLLLLRMMLVLTIPTVNE